MVLLNKIKIWFLKMCLNECVKDERDFSYKFFRFKLFLARKKLIRKIKNQRIELWKQ